MVDQFGYHILEEVIKMMMEVFLSEEKAKKQGYDIQKYYSILDDYFISNGVKKLSQGIYKGTVDHFNTFMAAQWDLPKTSWFLKIVDKWYCRYEGDTIEYREDALEIYYRVKARNVKFFKN